MVNTSPVTAMSVEISGDSSDIASSNGPQKRSLGDSSLLNWTYCIVGVVVSMIPVFVKPLAKSLIQCKYTDWFNDVFSNAGIIIISVSVAIAAMFELVIRGGEKNYLKFLLGSFLFLCTLVCISVYGVVTGVDEYKIHLGEAQTALSKLAQINIAFFCLMLLISTAAFIDRKSVV